MTATHGCVYNISTYSISTYSIGTLQHTLTHRRTIAIQQGWVGAVQNKALAVCDKHGHLGSIFGGIKHLRTKGFRCGVERFVKACLCGCEAVWVEVGCEADAANQLQGVVGSAVHPGQRISNARAIGAHRNVNCKNYGEQSPHR